MKQIEWSDELGSRSRQPWLILVANGQLYTFKGKDIPGVVAISSSRYVKNGKWSHTNYKLALAEGVREYPGKQGWNDGTYREGIGAYTWVAAANYYSIPLQVFKSFLKEWKPKAAEWYDNTEASIAAIDEITTNGADVISISFGGFTCRQREDGAWTRPIRVLLEEEEIASFTPEQYRQEGVTVGSCTITQYSYSSGRGGGYVSVSVVAPIGAKLVF